MPSVRPRRRLAGMRLAAPMTASERARPTTVALHSPTCHNARDMLATRVATAAAGIPLIALVVWAGGWWLAGVAAAAAAVATLEIAAARGSARTAFAPVAAAAAAALPLAAMQGGRWPEWVLAASVLSLTSLLAVARDPRRDVERWLWALASLLYFGWLGGRFVLLRESSDGREWLFLAVVSVWVADTGAYFVGRTLGRHKLAPLVSPNKTWEGAAAAQASGLAAVAGLHYAFGLGHEWYHVLALGLLLPLAAQAGDLAESGIKRGLGVKDTSGLVPGHGGIADRLDSLLFAVPALYYYLQWVI